MPSPVQSRKSLPRVIIGIPTLYGSYPLAVHNDVLHGGVQQQGDVRLLDHGRIYDVVPEGIALQRIVEEVAALHLLEYAGLLTLAFLDSDYAHPHFAGSIASEHGTVLDEDYLRTVSCSGNGGADSANHNLSVVFKVPHDLGVLFGAQLRIAVERQKHQKRQQGCEKLFGRLVHIIIWFGYYLAMATALVSRITVILTWPGYTISS